MNRFQSHRILFGLILLGFGLLTLLGNLNIVDTHALRAFWPLVFCALGISHLVRHPVPRRAVWGLGWIALGLAWTASNLGYLHLTAADLWPAILILCGLHILVKGFFPQQRCSWKNRGYSESVCTGHIQHSAVLSGAEIRNDTQDFQGGELTAMMGGIDLDLRQASMRSEATLRVSALMGGVKIHVPQDWTVIVRCEPVLGGVDDKTVPTPGSSKRLIIEGDLVCAGIEIRN